MKLTLLPFILALTACSTAPIAPPQVTGPHLIVSRDTGFMGGGCAYAVRVNDQVKGRLKAGEHLVLPLQPGTYEVSIGTGSYDSEGSSICPNLTTARIVHVTNVPAFTRIGTTTSGQLIFDQVK